MTDVKAPTIPSAVEFDFDTKAMGKALEVYARESTCCCPLSHADQQTVREFGLNHKLSIADGHLIYEAGDSYKVGTCCGRAPFNYIPPVYNSVPLSEIKQIKAVPDTSACCYRDRLVNVQIDTPARRGVEMSVYGLKDPVHVIKTITRMVRDEKRFERDYRLGGATAAAAAAVVSNTGGTSAPKTKAA